MSMNIPQKAEDRARNVSDTASNEPLIIAPENEQKSLVISDETVSFYDALKESTGIALFAVVGTFFHPFYSIINNIVLGHAEDETLLAGLGLGALTVGILGLSLGVCFAFGAGTFMSQEFGAKNFRDIHVYLNRSIFLNICVFIILYIPSLFISQFYEAIGQSPEIAAYGA